MTVKDTYANVTGQLSTIGAQIEGLRGKLASALVAGKNGDKEADDLLKARLKQDALLDAAAELKTAVSDFERQANAQKAAELYQERTRIHAEIKAIMSEASASLAASDAKLVAVGEKLGTVTSDLRKVTGDHSETSWMLLRSARGILAWGIERVKNTQLFQ